ncbi:MAG: hypothetical protein FWF56_03335 [Firmicutes bacterium]|nr:hypothetical protein [Bacillota bacterium]
MQKLRNTVGDSSQFDTRIKFKNQNFCYDDYIKEQDAILYTLQPKHKSKLLDGRWIAIIALSIAFVISLSFMLYAFLKPQSTNQSDVPSTNITQDFESLAEKYLNYFKKNDNNTVSLSLRPRLATDNPIVAEDMSAMLEYSQMLDNINKLVLDGSMYIAEDGNYYIKDDTSTTKAFGGKNQFYVKTNKILWVIPVPVGYYLALDLASSAIFGLIVWSIKKASSGVFASLEVFIAGVKLVVGYTFNKLLNQLGLTDGALFNTLYAIVISGIAVSAALNSSGAFSFGIVNLVDIIVRAVVFVLSSYIWDRVGSPFLLDSMKSYGELIINKSKNNTIEMNSDLILWNRTIEPRRY